MVKLNEKKIRWILRHRNSKNTEDIAISMRIGRRRVQQIIKEYEDTGRIPKLKDNRRPQKPLSWEEKQAIDEAWEQTHLGATYLRYHIRRHYKLNINHNRIHKYLLKTGKAKPNKRKQRKRTRCRYERKHSFSLLHADWHESKWIRGKHVIAFEDDASRLLLAGGEFSKESSALAVHVCKEAVGVAESYSSMIHAINTDRDSTLYVNKKAKKPHKQKLTEFQRFLIAKGIKHIPSRIKNPQTNGKVEKWFDCYEQHRARFNSFEDFRMWYNNRMHGSLDRENAETPNEAVLRKLRAESLIGLFIRLIE